MGLTGDWIGEFGTSANYLTNSMTNGTGTKFCGLQGVYGIFRGGFGSGVFLNAPSTQTGNWSMTVTVPIASAARHSPLRSAPACSASTSAALSSSSEP